MNEIAWSNQAPQVFVDDTFALKGGTAINLFVRDMPRLSVDLRRMRR
ncbi:nucleotidyl transferase AbiEii/AbiGii toxin family protein [Variovorax sp. J22R187]|nr:nucleotidyl transferase AbiEii/AbiGii toxin family protein [Variovorax sp. J22R187]MDM0017063.1 nucleotidyl transferase AbiEii/AbiGii toxin family protein [Variovorax sp. J22R187]